MSLEKLKLFLFLLALGSVSSSLNLVHSSSFEPPYSQQRNPAQVEVARINYKSISLDELLSLQEENQQLFPQQKISKESLLDQMIYRELGIQEAMKQGLHHDPEIVDQMNTALYQAFLKRTLAQELSKIHISDEDAQSFYEKNPDIRTSHIWVKFPKNSTKKQKEQAYEKINAIKKEIHSEKHLFSELAQRYSESPTSVVGGDLNFQSKLKLDPLYYETAMKLKKPGAVSDIIETEDAYFIVKLTAIRPWEEVHPDTIKQILLEQKKEEILKAFMKKLRQQSQIKVHSELLKN